MDVPVVEARKICKAFSGNKVLDNVDLAVRPGEVLCLVGENGSGKSTLIKILSGVYSHDAGGLIINGKNYASIAPSQSIDEGIQVIYQDFSVFPNLSVAENIAISHSIKERRKLVNWGLYRKLAHQALDMIGVELDVDQQVQYLSVAQKQIVAISRAILQDAKLIIMDEPTTALTQKEIERLFKIINDLKARGVAIIFVSHKLGEVFAVCDRIAVIRAGEIVIDERLEAFPRDKLVYFMTGKEIEERPIEHVERDLTPTIEARCIGLSGSFEELSFRVRPGEILAITGQLGSGRTELAKSLFGIFPIDSGEILIDGKVVPIRNMRDALANGIAYLPEDRLSEGLFLERSLGDNLAATIVDKLRNRFGLISDGSLRAISDRWIRELNMSEKPHTTMAGTFSGGNQQRIVVGKWLAAEPRIFVLNCPTVGVDVKSKSEIHGIMKNLAAKGLAIIMISDDLGEIESTSDRLIILNKGRIAFEGLTSSISQDRVSEKILAD
jgi:simple sugar transport system ATP-binding protein